MKNEGKYRQMFIEYSKVNNANIFYIYEKGKQIRLGKVCKNHMVREEKILKRNLLRCGCLLYEHDLILNLKLFPFRII